MGQQHEAVSTALLPHLRRARDLMDRSYVDPIDLRALARTAGCSRFHFLRAFRTAYGETPGKYLVRRRIERAKEYLRTTHLTVAEICQLVGFSSPGSFSTRFSELVGMSPTAYREQAIGDSGPELIPGCYLFMCSRLEGVEEVDAVDGLEGVEGADDRRPTPGPPGPPGLPAPGLPAPRSTAKPRRRPAVDRVPRRMIEPAAAIHSGHAAGPQF